MTFRSREGRRGLQLHLDCFKLSPLLNRPFLPRLWSTGAATLRKTNGVNAAASDASRFERTCVFPVKGRNWKINSK